LKCGAARQHSASAPAASQERRGGSVTRDRAAPGRLRNRRPQGSPPGEQAARSLSRERRQQQGIAVPAGSASRRTPARRSYGPRSTCRGPGSWGTTSSSASGPTGSRVPAVVPRRMSEGSNTNDVWGFRARTLASRIRLRGGAWVSAAHVDGTVERVGGRAGVLAPHPSAPARLSAVPASPWQWRLRRNRRLRGNHAATVTPTHRRRTARGPARCHRRDARAEPSRRLDSGFRPAPSTRARWQRVWLAESRGTVLTPISVVQVGGAYAIRDGHHRVSVAKRAAPSRSTRSSTPVSGRVNATRSRRAPRPTHGCPRRD
jgi:hypothetical protein